MARRSAKDGWGNGARALGLVLWIGVTAGTAVGAAAAENRLVVISPHNASIRSEFGRGFGAWHRLEYGEAVEVDWRHLGGTAEALRFVQSEFATKPAGIGIDCFFGGGPEPYLLLADRGLTLPHVLPAAVLEGVPQQANGVEVYDAEHHWYGAALSSFGILQNTVLERRLGLPQVSRWEGLADPRLYSWVAIGDPRNSGTMNNMFEAFLQAYGWERGWELLTAIGGNAAKFDRVSTSTAKDVTLGEAIYGFAIDFYGFTQVTVAGRTNMTFVLPEDFTSVSADGLCILKGAPNLVRAQRFLEFVIGEPGQKLWFLPRGHPEGAQRYSIERMSVRPEFYRRYREVSNIAFSPFDLKPSFRYNARLARERRDVVAALAGALLVDAHTELRHAWRVIIRQGVPVEARAALGRMPIGEAEALELSGEPWKNAALRNRRKIEWQTWAQEKYRRIAAEWSDRRRGLGGDAAPERHRMAGVTGPEVAFPSR